MKEFQNLNSSMSTLLRFLIGDRDAFEQMKVENKYLANVFYWTFCVLGLFLYMNFFISILMESFEEVKEQSIHVSLQKQAEKFGHEFGLLVSIQGLYHRLVLLRKRKSLNVVLQELYHKTVVPHRARMAARARWAKVREQVMAPVLKKSTLKVLVKQVQDTPKTERSHITSKQFKAMIPEEAMALMGHLFFDHLWEEMVWQYDVLYEKSREQEEKKEQVRAMAVPQAHACIGKLHALTALVASVRKKLTITNSLIAAKVSQKARTRMDAILKTAKGTQPQGHPQ